MRMFAVAVVFLLGGGAAAVAQHEQLENWMKASGSASDALRKMESKTGRQAVSAAERLGGSFEEVFEFFRLRNVADAAGWAQEAKAASVELASAANAGNAAKADDAFKRVTAACQSCHKVHRERTPDGKYRLK